MAEAPYNGATCPLTVAGYEDAYELTAVVAISMWMGVHWWCSGAVGKRASG